MAKRVLKQHLPEHFQRKASLCWGPGLLQQPECPQTGPKGTTPWALHYQSYPRWLLPAGAVPCYLWLLCQHTEVQLLNPGGCLSFTGDVHPLSQSSHRAHRHPPGFLHLHHQPWALQYTSFHTAGTKQAGFFLYLLMSLIATKVQVNCYSASQCP